MQYRPEIDGLRAIAVVPVILFHTGLGLMPGGFVGVDVFFVISGYLITAIILNDLARDRFSIVNFYERRVRRIAPALLVVCIACLPFAALWMLPSELDDFGKDLFHSLLMVSNFELWDNTGYFSPSTELKPLLHTWSLSVEEQFYLVFPVLLWMVRKQTRQVIFRIVAVLALISLFLAWPVSRVDPVANFYLPFTRFWELAAGALLAIGGIPTRYSERTRSALGLAGLILIVGSCLFLTSELKWPGPVTLAPVVGTLLVIAFAGPGNLAGRLLSLRPLVAIGLISYSLYLWHQPVFAFARLRSMDMLPGWSYGLLVALVFALAIASYFLVEQPFRKPQVGRRLVFSLSGSLAAVLVVLGIVTTNAQGFPGRHPVLTAMGEPSLGIGKICNGEVRPDVCTIGQGPEMAVWGDSLAMHLVDGLAASMHDTPSDQGEGLVQLHKNSCAFPTGIAPIPLNDSASWPLDCIRHNEAVKAYLAKTPSLRTVVLGSQYLTYLRSDRRVMTAQGQAMRTDYGRMLAEVEATADWLRSIGLRPVFMAPPPRDGRDIGRCVVRSAMLDVADTPCMMERDEQRAHDALVERLMADVSKRFPVVSLEDYLCDEKSCRVVDDGVSLFLDDEHFSHLGSIHLGKTLDLYDALTDAAQHGCEAGVKVGEPKGICQLKPTHPVAVVQPGRSSGLISAP